MKYFRVLFLEWDNIVRAIEGSHFLALGRGALRRFVSRKKSWLHGSPYSSLFFRGKHTVLSLFPLRQTNDVSADSCCCTRYGNVFHLLWGNSHAIHSHGRKIKGIRMISLADVAINANSCFESRSRKQVCSRDMK